MKYAITISGWVMLAAGVHTFGAPAATGVAVKDEAVIEMLSKAADWFATPEAISRIDRIISYQLPSGGWEKGYTEGPSPDPNWAAHGAIDNDFTYTEIRALARAYNATKRPSVLDAVNRGIDFLLTAQYPNGGWPQRYPAPQDYGGQITLNDEAMVNVMRLMRDVATHGDFAFADPTRKAKAKESFDRGLDCLLKLQLTQNGKRTAWAQQYDPVTMQPVTARTYELPCITANETDGVLRLLMTLENPSPAVVQAVYDGVAWLQASKITGTQIVRKPDPLLPKGFDVVLVADPAADPIWARCYDIETNRPFVCGRDGVKKWNLSEIEAERRSGYAWYGRWCTKSLKQFDEWSKQHPRPQTTAH